MASSVTLRLDPDLRRRVERIARRRRTSKSQILREAVTTWVSREEVAGSVYELIVYLIGNVRGGDPTLSEDMGRKFTELLRARRE